MVTAGMGNFAISNMKIEGVLQKDVVIDSVTYNIQKHANTSKVENAVDLRACVTLTMVCRL